MFDNGVKILNGVSILILFGFMLTVIIIYSSEKFPVEPKYEENDKKLLDSLEIFTTEFNDMAVKFAGHMKISLVGQLEEKQYLPIKLKMISTDYTDKSSERFSFNLTNDASNLNYTFLLSNRSNKKTSISWLDRIDATFTGPKKQVMTCRINLPFTFYKIIEFKWNSFECSAKKYYDCWNEKPELHVIASLYIRMFKFELRREVSDRTKFEYAGEEICKNLD